MQRHLGAAARLAHGFDRILAAAGRFPAHAVLSAESGAARDQRYLVSRNERRIEADAELADQVRVLRLVAGERLEELARAGFGDGADVGNHLVARHADAVVGDRDGARRLIEADANFELGIVFKQILAGQRLEAQLVAGVGRIGDQLAQEDLLVAVQRVDHEVEQLLDLGLKSECFLAGRGFHCRISHVETYSNLGVVCAISRPAIA